MAGHSQFKNIMHRKAGQDSKRGKIFTKLIREITTAARQSGPDPDSNPRLRVAIDKALGNNMTKDTITRAIKRGSGESDGEQMLEIRYEGYGPFGVAVIVDCLTDNKNRTVGEVRHAFTKSGGNLGTTGSVSYLFRQAGIISFPPGHDENKILEIALDAGAEDVAHNDDESIDVTTTPEHFEAVKIALNAAGLITPYAEITWLASVKAPLTAEQSQQLIALTDMLDDLDDVQQVYTNADF